MSYIRSLSNPEGLYIWGDTNGEAIILSGEPSIFRSMPNKLWDKLLETWTKNWHDDVALTMVIGGVKHEVSLTERLSPMKPSLKEMVAAISDGGEHLEIEEHGRMKVCITYKNDRDEREAWILDDIWPVTMHYIAQHQSNPYYNAGWFKKFILKLLRIQK